MSWDIHYELDRDESTPVERLIANIWAICGVWGSCIGSGMEIPESLVFRSLVRHINMVAKKEFPDDFDENLVKQMSDELVDNHFAQIMEALGHGGIPASFPSPREVQARAIEVEDAGELSEAMDRLKFQLMSEMEDPDEER